MNCIIPKNSNKNLFIVHSEKKGKEKLEENKTIQMRSEKKLKIIKLNLKLIQNKTQENKNMSTGRLSNQNVSTHNKKNRHITQQTSRQLGKLIYTGRRTVNDESTQYDNPYLRSTPIIMKRSGYDDTPSQTCRRINTNLFKSQHHIKIQHGKVDIVT